MKFTSINVCPEVFLEYCYFFLLLYIYLIEVSGQSCILKTMSLSKTISICDRKGVANFVFRYVWPYIDFGEIY
jgi:hypothetical protein